MKFHKISDPQINPVLGPIEESTFKCPVRRKEVNWEAKDVFNPAAVVKDGKVHLLYRAEDRVREPVGWMDAVFLVIYHPCLSCLPNFLNPLIPVFSSLFLSSPKSWVPTQEPPASGWLGVKTGTPLSTA